MQIILMCPADLLCFTLALIKQQEIGNYISRTDNHKPKESISYSAFDLTESFFIIWLGQEHIALYNNKYQYHKCCQSKYSIDDSIEDRKIVGQYTRSQFT